MNRVIPQFKDKEDMMEAQWRVIETKMPKFAGADKGHGGGIEPNVEGRQELMRRIREA